jgi:hypothetical protein
MSVFGEMVSERSGASIWRKVNLKNIQFAKVHLEVHLFLAKTPPKVNLCGLFRGKTIILIHESTDLMRKQAEIKTR